MSLKGIMAGKQYGMKMKYKGKAFVFHTFYIEKLDF